MTVTNENLGFLAVGVILGLLIAVVIALLNRETPVFKTKTKVSLLPHQRPLVYTASQLFDDIPHLKKLALVRNRDRVITEIVWIKKEDGMICVMGQNFPGNFNDARCDEYPYWYFELSEEKFFEVAARLPEKRQTARATLHTIAHRLYTTESQYVRFITASSGIAESMLVTVTE
jgi:hypothetical protein